MGNEKQKGKAFALLPIGVFLVIFLGAGILFKDFYAMPAVVAFLIALFVAFLQNRKVSFQKKMEVIAKGLGEENIITMCLIFLCAGAFSGAVTAHDGSYTDCHRKPCLFTDSDRNRSKRRDCSYGSSHRH